MSEEKTPFEEENSLPNDMQTEDNAFPPMTEEETKSAVDTTENKDERSISADLIRGHINTIILRSLFNGDRYGYDIINEIEQKSHGQYILKQPTLYSALRRLESQGYVKSYWGGVSNGGRRRYFSLTDEGKEIVRHNQEEWAYSRTIIDNLISNEQFDFTKPAPQKLDFRILRQTTSRTPIVGESEELPPTISATNEAVKEENTTTQTVETEQKTPSQEPTVQLYAQRPTEERNYKDIIGNIYRSSLKEQPEVQQPIKPASPVTLAPPPVKEPVQMDLFEKEEEKQEPVKEKNKQVKVVPGKIGYEDIKEQATQDGLRIWVAGEGTKTKPLPEDFFNKGLTLFKSSICFFIVAFIETLLVLIFKDKLFHSDVNAGVYLTFMFIFTFAPFILGFLAWYFKYQPYARRLKDSALLSTVVIASIMLAILILGFNFLFAVNLKDVGMALISLFIPTIYLLNLYIFTVPYYLWAKSKI